ncbi:MAG: T9SS type A sorting domain-containing protein, partial [Bacteroidales bacterium]|nr:T9SS type A sorting domain-containing protein [Bacteroidales bacterium]
YEYWFDGDYNNKVESSVALTDNLNLSTLIPTVGLADGVHTYHIRFKDDSGLWSSTLSQFFYKMPQQLTVNNKIASYRYWFDDDLENVIVENLAVPIKNLSLINDFDLTNLPKGIHTISFQFKDSLGLWSAVTTDTIEKLSLPVADFSYSATFVCDSTVYTLTNKSVDSDIYNWNFGDGLTDSIENPVHTYYVPGTYTISLTVTDTLSGQDSTKHLQITVLGATFSEIDTTVCGAYLSPSSIYTWTSSGVYTDTISNHLGCDSIVTINLTVNSSTSGSISKTACYSYTAPDGQVYTTSGIKTAVIPNAAGCDSTITINLTIAENTSSAVSIVACDSYTAPDGQVYTNSGEIIAVIPNAAGCDSIITINLEIKQSSSNTIFVQSCDSYLAPDGTVYTTSGTKTAIIPNAAGCDSIIAIELTIMQSTASSVSEVAYESYTAPDGAIYTTSGIIEAVIPNSAGCDSVITIDLTILGNTSSTISQTVCDSYVAPDGAVYTTSGTKTAVIPNAAGYDSTITIFLTIKESSTSLITETACDSYTAPDGQVYSTSGIKTAVIPNAAGCDSIITIDLNILQATSSSITATACDSYTAPDGQVYSTSGIKTAVIPNTAGCDSTISIDLTINTVDIAVTQNSGTLTANAVPASYRWLDCNNNLSNLSGENGQVYNAASSGSYAVEISQNGCIDTSECYSINVLNSMEITFESEIVVFPNPTKGIVHVDLGSESSNVEVSINDIAGSLVKKYAFKNQKTFAIEIEQNSGFYIMSVKSDKINSSFMLLKE